MKSYGLENLTQCLYLEVAVSGRSGRLGGDIWKWPFLDVLDGWVAYNSQKLDRLGLGILLAVSDRSERLPSTI